jgi:glycolate oxidase FAD binding subunit
VTSDSPLFDDSRLQSVVRPASVAELGETIRGAAAVNLGLCPFGGATMLHLGLPPTKPGIAVDMRGFDQVIDYPARDMTITVQASITIARLQEVLAAENQRLPMDIPRPQDATLGGALAVNASGPRRYGHGTLRDYVIGISFMNDAGHEVKAGGRVVKNVAGYDLCKLHIGALGTLGIITQVTLKVKPRPERQQALSGNIPTEDLPSLCEALPKTQTRPVAVDTHWLSDGASRSWRIAVLFEDNSEAVDWQIAQLQREIPNVLQPMSDSLIQAGLAAGQNFPLTPGANFSFKANLLPSALPAFLQEAVIRWPCSALLAHIGNGIVHGHWFGDLTLGDAGHIVKALRERAVAAGGNLVITRCQPEWKRELKVWGEPRGNLALMRAVKKAIDPHNLFNPGRFLV